VAAKPLRRIGIFGGAFDPPHAGHVALASTALNQLQLDMLRVIPTGQAWHKARALTHAAYRIEMARLAFAQLPRVVVDPRETVRSGPSYTVDTLLELQAEFPHEEFFLIMGQDQAAALPTWSRWREIANLATICVASRADSSGNSGIFDASSFEIPGLRQLQMPPMEVSATDIRLQLAHHETISPLVFEPVARYIAHHHLYQTA
jgi:nicotinate-nucleotide adenylyltransferase